MVRAYAPSRRRAAAEAGLDRRSDSARAPGGSVLTVLIHAPPAVLHAGTAGRGAGSSGAALGRGLGGFRSGRREGREGDGGAQCAGQDRGPSEFCGTCEHVFGKLGSRPDGFDEQTFDGPGSGLNRGNRLHANVQRARGQTLDPSEDQTSIFVRIRVTTSSVKPLVEA